MASRPFILILLGPLLFHQTCTPHSSNSYSPHLVHISPRPEQANGYRNTHNQFVSYFKLYGKVN